MDRVLAGSSSSYIAAPLNVPRIQELLNQAADAEQNMLTAVNEANIHAEACNKPKLRLLQQN
jgi:L-serine deaminase